MCLHRQVLVGNGANAQQKTVSACVPSNAGIPEFYDASETAYYSSDNPWGSTMTAGSKMRATVLSESGGNITVQVVTPAQ
jgi:immune inhibitor A